MAFTRTHTHTQTFLAKAKVPLAASVTCFVFFVFGVTSANSEYKALTIFSLLVFLPPGLQQSVRQCVRPRQTQANAQRRAEVRVWHVLESVQAAGSPVSSR